MKQGKNAVRFFNLLVLFIILFSNNAVKAQKQPVYSISQAKQFKTLMDTVRKDMPVEKLYLHLDKFNYLAGDTLWLKAYLLEGPFLMPSSKSGLFYVELVNAENKVLKRMKFPAKYGMGWGNISLDERDLPTGNYLLRAYTNWMLNFGEAAAYTANIYISNATLPSNAAVLKKAVKNLNTPLIPNTGTTLGINSSPEKADMELTITAEGEAKNLSGYYLVGQSRGVVCYAIPVNLKDGKIVNAVPKSLFPTGIARFTLIDKNLKALNERMIYIDQHDQLTVNVSTVQAVYKSRDSIALRIKVTDKNNEPVQGSFSLSVTDDSQVAQGPTKNGDLNTYMLLSSELRNQPKSADAYSNGTVAAQQALDSLALTAGWLGYNWNELSNYKIPKYSAEPEFMITGKVSSTFSGLAGAKVSLFVKKPLLFMDTVAGPDGRFIFKNLPIADTAVYKIQATNKKGKNFFVNLEVDEWKPPVFSPLLVNYSTEAQVKDPALEQKVEKALALKQQQDKSTGKLLNEVNIEAKKIVKGSHNLNGSGEADQVLTESDLLKEGKRPLYELLMARIPGLVMGSYLYPPSKIRKFGLKLKNQLVKIIIDGIDLDQSYEYWQLMADADDSAEGLQERYTHIKTNLDNFTAEDVKGIEVMYNASYNVKYNNKFLSTAETSFSGKGGLTGVGGASGIDYTYIEITTRNGRGPFMKQTPGTYLYKPLAFSLPKKFYSPKYLNKDSSVPDIRSTIYWEPNIITDEKGEATVSFYAAGQPSSYTIAVEGSDMNGQLGSARMPALIKIAP
ncbi:hypothetical protein HDC92_002005 [Pedobacter sp. AK017]|uniref:carboxypeptidase-like regulatory domain-containing protein n=1 Tax=Pedobacter sp. AK017 TaxID=2723073 RepID=UPI0016195AF8|nr:carboxypeptidase-like regulatory domain-containing protein [Pedobacter sp. AK017]MBB5438330.1 hypothetical protein [Pedobacter sp. AK017]